jgi:GTP1/Obg family GTP-binding protein
MKKIENMIASIESIVEAYDMKIERLNDKDTLNDKQEETLTLYEDIVSYLNDSLDALNEALNSMEEIKGL